MKVLLEIEVPEGDYCWDNETSEICRHFDNEGGNAECGLDIGYPLAVRSGAIKPPSCRSLPKAKEQANDS